MATHPNRRLAERRPVHHILHRGGFLSCRLRQLALGENGVQMQRHVPRRGLEKLRNLGLRQPDGLVLKPALDARPPVLRLVEDDFGWGQGHVAHG